MLLGHCFVALVLLIAVKVVALVLLIAGRVLLIKPWFC